MKLKIDGTNLVFLDYPFACACAASGKPVPASAISEILPERAPPEVWLKSDEILFVSAMDIEDLVGFADAHQIPLTNRLDVWGLLCEEALDTELSEQSRASTIKALAESGIAPNETRKIRARTIPRLLKANAVWWEWVHLGHYDMLSANKRMFFFGGDRFRRLYDDSMVIARKAGKLPFDEQGFRRRLEACFEPELYAIWMKTLSLSGITAGARDAFRDLIRRYRQQGRHYHDLQHIEEVVSHISAELSRAENPAAVLWAGWFHDFYPPWKKNAEARSADEADTILAAIGVDAPTRNRVRDLIMVTAGHFVAKGPDETLLADADLLVLGADEWRYRSYAEGVRSEYAHIPKPLFVQGRKKFLRSLLAKAASGGRLSFHQSDAWEQQAVRNIERELSQL